MFYVALQALRGRLYQFGRGAEQNEEEGEVKKLVKFEPIVTQAMIERAREEVAKAEKVSGGVPNF